MQHNLFFSSLDSLQPEVGRTAPLLWVRRLVIWRARGEIIRDVSLKTGLNVVWSPDSGQEGDPVGHGGGKTSFCRLIRYCLGEDSFGSQSQKQMIISKLIDGYVGAEIILDDVPWVVLRPIGTGKAHYCALGENLDEAFTPELSNTGLGPLRQAITKIVMSDAASNMPVANRAEDGWEAALAWLTRDQECRLRDALDWRAPQTQSQSPSRQMSEAERLITVRLLINALLPQELTATATFNRRVRELESAKGMRKRLENLVSDLRYGLEQEFGDETPVEAAQVELWSEKAAEKLKETEAKFDPDVIAKLNEVRAKRKAVELSLNRTDIEIANIDGRLTEKASTKTRLETAQARAHVHVLHAEKPICLECGQLLRPEDVSFVEQRRKEKEAANLEALSIADDVEGLKTERSDLIAKRRECEKDLTKFNTATSELEMKFQDQSLHMSQAKGHVTMTKRFVAHKTELTTNGDAIESMAHQQSLLAEEIIALRRTSAEQIARLSNHFDAVLQYLVPDNLQGDIILDRNGLQLRPRMSGDLTTAAIDSLKIVAFDLAALLLTIEGKTQLPGILIHDSPREADLGLSIYNRLFSLIEKIEGFGPAPLFQYIVTTTTAPPEAYCTLPWMRLELHGAPADQRLFKEDL